MSRDDTAPVVLAYRDVRKQFGDFVALAGVSMEVRKTEAVCLIGPSGSGKSTLLRCTNGLEIIDGGEILLDGRLLPRDSRAMRAVRQRMGMVFQNFELFPQRPREVLNVMKALADDGMTMLVVTHEMAFARRVADHLVVFEGGTIIEQGPPAQIFDAPLVGQTREFLSHLGWPE